MYEISYLSTSENPFYIFIGTSIYIQSQVHIRAFIAPGYFTHVHPYNGNYAKIQNMKDMKIETKYYKTHSIKLPFKSMTSLTK